MKAALHNYHARMQRVLDHIDRHLEDDLDLDAVSGVAAFSKYHFHRQFTATFGLTVHRYIQLARMKRASYRLAYRDAQSVTDIAMDAGYDAPDAFARAFRQRVSATRVRRRIRRLPAPQAHDPQLLGQPLDIIDGPQLPGPARDG